MKSKINIEFPCGYKYHVELETSLFESWSIDSTLEKECPLHGKDCSQKKK